MRARWTVGLDRLPRLFRRWRRSDALWLICAGLIIATVAAATLSTIALRRDAQEADRQEISAVGTALAAQTSRYVQVIRLALNRVQHRVDQVQVTTPEDFDRLMSDRTTFDLLRQVGHYLPQADALAILDRSGRLINFTRAYPPPQLDAADRDFYHYLRDHRGGGLYFSRPLVARFHNIPATVAARRLNAPDGSFLGVAAAVISIRELQSFYASMIGVNGQTTKLLRRDGTVLVTWPLLPHPFTRVPTPSHWYAAIAAGGGTYHASGRFVSVHPLADYPLVINAQRASATSCDDGPATRHTCRLRRLARRSESPHPRDAAARRPCREQRADQPLLADRPRHPRPPGGARLGRQGGRPPGRRPARGVSRLARLLVGQSALYAGVRRSLARSGNSPTGRWQIALGREHRTGGKWRCPSPPGRRRTTATSPRQRSKSPSTCGRSREVWTIRTMRGGSLASV